MSGSKRIVSRPMNPFDGHSGDNGYGAQYTLKLPVGMTYRQLHFKLVDLDIDQIEEITLSLNGDMIVSTDGATLDMLRVLTGQYRSPANDVLVLPFTDTTQTPMQEQNWSELPTGPGENLILKIKTGARKAAQAGKAGVIEARYMMGPERGMRVRVPRLMVDGLSGNRSGKNVYERLIRMNRAGAKAWIQRVVFMNDKIDNLRVLMAGREIFDKTLDDNNFDLRSNGQLPPANVFVYDCMSEGFGAFDSIADEGMIDFELNLTQAGSFSAVMQYVQLLPQPVVWGK